MFTWLGGRSISKTTRFICWCIYDPFNVFCNGVIFLAFFFLIKWLFLYDPQRVHRHGHDDEVLKFFALLLEKSKTICPNDGPIDFSLKLNMVCLDHAMLARRHDNFFLVRT